MIDRFKLIPTIGRGGRFVYGTVDDALILARAMHEARDCQVVVVSHPEGGLVRPVAVIGDPPKKKAASDAQANPHPAGKQ
jgi:hypothetical protein